MPLSFGISKSGIFKSTPAAGVVTDQLILYFDPGNSTSYPGSGNIVTDISTGGNNGTLSSITYSASNSGTFVLDATTDRIDCGTTTQMSTTAYTKCLWVNLSSYAYNNFISGGSTAQHAFWMLSSTKILAGHNGTYNWITSTQELSLNRWYFVCLTFSTSQGMKIYINGSLDATNATATAFAKSGNGELHICSYASGNNGLTGSIGPAMVYNKSLSASEITQNYNTFKSRFGL